MPEHRAERREIVVIQQLRGIAALLVVLHHSLAPVPWIDRPFRASLGFGQGGVDIFFVISGCVMYVAARHETVIAFGWKRLIRIVPLYWLATLVFVLLRLAHWREPELTAETLLRSLMFVPYRAVSYGPIYPVLVPGWTLNIELFFYVLFGVGLAIGRPALIAAALVTASVLAGAVLAPTAAAAVLYSSPMLLEFVVGLGLGALFVRDQLPTWMQVALPFGAAALLLSDVVAGGEALVRGVGGVLVVAGALAVEQGGRTVRFVPLKAFGDASYALYLFHTPVLMLARKLFVHRPLGGTLEFVAYQVVAIAGSIAVALLIHCQLERPLLALARRLVLRRRPAAG